MSSGRRYPASEASGTQLAWVMAGQTERNGRGPVAMNPKPQPTLAPPGLHPIESDIPARLDRLPWSRFHWLLIVALGITWVLDGLETNIVAAITPELMRPTTLGLSPGQMGLGASLYLAGAIVGAL